MNLKFESIVQIYRKIIHLNAVITLKTLKNEYYRIFFSKSGHKMDIYPAMCGDWGLRVGYDSFVIVVLLVLAAVAGFTFLTP